MLIICGGAVIDWIRWCIVLRQRRPGTSRTVTSVVRDPRFNDLFHSSAGYIHRAVNLGLHSTLR